MIKSIPLHAFVVVPLLLIAPLVNGAVFPFQGTWRQLYANRFVLETQQIDWTCVSVHLSPIADHEYALTKKALLHGGTQWVANYPTLMVNVTSPASITLREPATSSGEHEAMTYSVFQPTPEVLVLTSFTDPSMYIWARHIHDYTTKVKDTVSGVLDKIGFDTSVRKPVSTYSASCDKLYRRLAIYDTPAPTAAPTHGAYDNGAGIAGLPSDDATAAPTATPSAAPTATPSAAPTHGAYDNGAGVAGLPSDDATAAPTASPTGAPTATPSASPTATPSAAPTHGAYGNGAGIAGLPSDDATAAPTATPTGAPTPCHPETLPPTHAIYWNNPV